jgi:hypothetical protein
MDLSKNDDFNLIAQSKNYNVRNERNLDILDEYIFKNSIIFSFL